MRVQKYNFFFNYANFFVYFKKKHYLCNRYETAICYRPSQKALAQHLPAAHSLRVLRRYRFRGGFRSPVVSDRGLSCPLSLWRFLRLYRRTHHHLSAEYHMDLLRPQTLEPSGRGVSYLYCHRPRRLAAYARADVPLHGVPVWNRPLSLFQNAHRRPRRAL